MSTTCHCGATWTGHRIEHCTECHETFTGTTAGDKHRVGQHHLSTGPDRRRCLTPDEMRAKGMEQNARGQWTNGGTSPWAKALQTGPTIHMGPVIGHIEITRPPEHYHRWAWAMTVSGATLQQCYDCGRERR